jgi:hypothetical protein
MDRPPMVNQPRATDVAQWLTGAFDGAYDPRHDYLYTFRGYEVLHR